MGEVAQISEFGKILIFLIVGFMLVGFSFFLSKLIAPNNPTPEKLTSYECGEEPEGNAWLQFNPKFYVIAIIFLLFDVEMVFIFPWATVFGNHELIRAEPLWGWFSLGEMFLFIGILVLGLVYVWVKGDLDWIKAKPLVPVVDTKIPKALYDKLNLGQSTYKTKPFSMETLPLYPKPAIDAHPSSAATTAAPEITTVTPPKFKPSFRKPAHE